MSGPHSLFWVTGSDAVGFLGSLVSQDVAGMEPGSGALSFLLHPQGKIDHILWLLRDEERVGVVVESHRLEACIAALRRFRIRVDADFEVDERPLHARWDTGEALGWGDDGGLFTASIALRGHRLSWTTEAGTTDADAYLAGRIAAGLPSVPVDVDDSTIPEESGLVPHAVSFTKGCYLGQELVARIDSRGHVNRRLVRLSINGEAVPGPVTVDGTEVGSLTSVVSSPAGSLGLATVHRTVEAGVRVEVSGSTATVISLDGEA